MSDGARDMEVPATLPFPLQSVPPDGAYSIIVPPSSETRIMSIEFFAERTPKPTACVGKHQFPFANGAVVVAFRAVSSLPSAASGV